MGMYCYLIAYSIGGFAPLPPNSRLPYSLGELVEYLQVQGALPWEMAWDEADGVED